MHRCCARFSYTPRRLYNRNANVKFQHAPLAARFQSRLTSSGAPHDDPGTAIPAPPRQRRGRAKKPLVLATLALLGALAWYHLNPAPPKLSILDERRFQPFTLTSKTRVSSTSSIFTLLPSSPSSSPSSPDLADSYAALFTHGTWSVEFKQPQLQIARSYTPLPPLPSSPRGELRFLIRREYGGEVSNYLDRLPVGATIDVRGPELGVALGADVSEVLFLAGGTGIAPALQAVRGVLGESEAEGEGRRVKILWANRRREDCAGAPPALRGWSWSSLWAGSGRATREVGEPPNAVVEEIRRLERQYPGRLEVEYFVDADGSFIDKARIADAVKSAAGREEGRRIIMVSGPEGFVRHFAGARGREGQQGRVGGVIEGVGIKGWEVVKL